MLQQCETVHGTIVVPEGARTTGLIMSHCLVSFIMHLEPEEIEPTEGKNLIK